VPWLRRLVAGHSPRRLGSRPGQSSGICGEQSGNGTGFSQSSSVLPCRYHSTMCSTFHNVLHIPTTPKEFIHYFHSFIHSFISSGDGQQSRKSGRSPVRRQSHPHNQNTRTFESLHTIAFLKNLIRFIPKNYFIQMFIWNFIHPQHTFLFQSFYIRYGNMFRCQCTIIRPYFIKCLPTTTEQNNQNQLKPQLSQSQFKVKITMLNIKIIIK
jgi:hypothetical protein